MSGGSIAELYCKGTKIWIADRNQVWVGGEVVRVVEGGGVEVKCEEEEGTTRVLDTRSPNSLPLLRNPEVLIGCNNLTALSYLHEPAVLHNLSVRFLHQKMIYTYCGIVLVALNPYTSLPIYGSETAAAYRGRDLGEMDPHIFAVAEEAFRRMTRDGTNQSLIVSGESGAGKTVSAKFVMRYFATVGGASTETQIEKKVLASNPIMEAIGNAKTTRNDNSSRFGKYIEIRFDRKNRITGAHMRTYLLERSRVVTQATSERNYHIFYQLCSAAAAAGENPETSEFQLGPAESFCYTSKGDCVAIDDVNDQSDFASTKEAMKLLGFRDDQLGGIFGILAAVLHLGNVEIDSSNKGGEVMSVIGEDDKSLVTSATLLGVDPAQLAHWLSHRKITTVREVYNKPLTQAQSMTAIDSLAKSLYSRVFDEVVNIINSALSPSSSSSSSSGNGSSIGVLDIYGFEVFQENNFEQFCINYANEKLQQQFNMHVFQLEQAEYIKEEIDWSFIDYYDNQPCIDLIESRLGILDLLDETCKMPGSCDSLFVQKLYDNHATPSSTHFSKPRTSRSEFQIRHYAGPVQYQTQGFVEKNTEQVAEEFTQLFSQSSKTFVAKLFNKSSSVGPVVEARLNRNGHTSRRNGMRSTVTKVTVGSQFRASLRGLMTTLNSTTPHYVRCIKSNDKKLPFVFNRQRAIQQLRACGVLETVRLSAAGYPSRWTYTEFFHRYRMLLSSGQVRRDDVRLMCQYILRITIQDESQYRFGKTKLFFRAGQVAYLEKRRSERLYQASVCLQRHVRGWLTSSWYRRFRTAAIFTQSRIRGLLARRLAVCLRRTRAVIVIQTQTRGLLARLEYQRLRQAAITVQTIFRGNLARKHYIHLLHHQKAVVIQKCVRGWVARLSYTRTIRCVIVAQSCVRRWLAKRERRRLKLEARSVNHLQGLNKGLELKIIQLQIKLDEGEKERAVAQQQWNLQKLNYEQSLSDANDEIRSLKYQLDTATRSAAAVAMETAEAAAPPHSEQGQSGMECDQSGMEQSQVDNLEQELVKLREALKESEEERCRLADRVVYLETEYDQENPVPALQNGTKTDDKSGYSLTPPSPPHLRHHPLVISTKLDDPLAKPVTVPYSSTPADTPLPHSAISLSNIVVPMANKGHQFGAKSGQEDGNSGQTDTKSRQGKDDSTRSEMSGYTFESGSGFLSDSEIECFKELVDQLEREKYNLLHGNRELSLEQKRIEASTTKMVTTLKKLDRENGLLRQQLAAARESEDSFRAELGRSQERAESLSNKVTVLKQALLQASTLSSLNASLQQEVTRLTTDNLSLQEMMEDMKMASYRTPMSPRRRTTPCGADSPQRKTFSNVRRQVAFTNEKAPLSSSRQQSTKWSPSQQSQLVRDLVLEFKVHHVVGVSGEERGGLLLLPAHMIHTGLGYCRHVTGSGRSAMSFLDEVTSAIQQVVQNNSTHLSILTLWLSNTTHLINLINKTSQTSLKSRPTRFNIAPASVSSTPLISDLSARLDKLESVQQVTFRDVFQIIYNRIQPLIVPGLLEFDSIPNISSVRPILGSHSTSHDPNITVATVTRELSTILDTLRYHSIPQSIIQAFMKQTFYTINAFLLNNLLLRRDMCHWSRGIQIRYNLSQLEDWARTNNLSGTEVLAQLQPSVEAAKLLQMKKSTPKDAESICELCIHLNPLQVQKLLTMYSPANDYEDRVPASVVRLVAQKSGADSTDPAHLMASIDHIFPVSFPRSLSDSLATKTPSSLPPSLNHLEYLLSNLN